ncbi:MAG TPA: hypothetical protein VGJ04_03230 [Pirellulales bacterium]|jgi:hypothetical protein
MQYDKFNQNELNCAAFKSRLDALLDSRRRPQLDLQLCTHARRCEPCARVLAAQTKLLEAVQTPTRLEVRPDFAVQVLQSIEVQQQQQRRSRRRAISFVAVAASLFIVVTAWRVPNRTEDLSESDLANSPKIPPAVLQRMDEVSQDIKPVSGSVYTALNAIWLAQRLL